jgi:hypothetical protein
MRHQTTTTTRISDSPSPSPTGAALRRGRPARRVKTTADAHALRISARRGGTHLPHTATCAGVPLAAEDGRPARARHAYLAGDLGARLLPRTSSVHISTIGSSCPAMHRDAAAPRRIGRACMGWLPAGRLLRVGRPVKPLQLACNLYCRCCSDSYRILEPLPQRHSIAISLVY